MSLRTRLILAFFFLSIVPLTAITAYSYRSSERALRDAAQAEGQQAAAEMGRRMELVTSEVSQRLDRLWDLPRVPEVKAVRGTGDIRSAEQLARVLGSAATMLERLEFVPNPPAPPPPPGAPGTGGPAPRPVPPPRGPAASASSGGDEPSAEAQRVVIDVNAAIQEAVQAVQDARGVAAGQASPAWVATLTKGLAEGLQAGTVATAEGLRHGAQELARRAEAKERAAEARAIVRHWSWDGMDVPIERGGKVVGTVNAKMNPQRVLGTVFALARTEQGEVPFAVDAEGRLFAPTPRDRSTLESLGVAPEAGEPGATHVLNRDNWIVVKRKDASGLTFGIARPLGESLEALRRASLRNLSLGLLAIGLAAIGIAPVSRRMTRDLTVLAESAREMAAGNFSVRVPVRSQDEIGRLAVAFNRMAEGVQAHQKLTVEQERLQRELELCRRIQNEMLPHGTLRVGLTEVKGVSIPAREVGGDFFNYFALDNGQIALMVGDVSGKGVGAALLMANVQATLRARLPLERDLARLVDAIDRDVDERTPGGVYVTLFLGILDPRSRTLRYVNAGHHPQFLLRHDGGLERMPSAGLPVGLYAGHGYDEHQVSVKDGDLIFFYTDGIVETENEAGDMFGLDQLEALLTADHEGDLDSVLERVEAALRTFRGRADLFDDATMMALRVGGDAAAI